MTSCTSTRSSHSYLRRAAQSRRSAPGRSSNCIVMRCVLKRPNKHHNILSAALYPNGAALAGKFWGASRNPKHDQELEKAMKNRYSPCRDVRCVKCHLQRRCRADTLEYRTGWSRSAFLPTWRGSSPTSAARAPSLPRRWLSMILLRNRNHHSRSSSYLPITRTSRILRQESREMVRQ